MYQANGTYYIEKHSVSFGDLKKTTVTKDNITTEYWTFDKKANTWDTWHLIPSSRPSIVHPNPITKIIEIPGIDGTLDLSEYLTGRVTYGQRQGTLTFYVDNGHEDWETIRMSMVKMLHGKTLKMQLDDDPGFYYEGRFTVGNWESGANYSTISIGYNLAPYKIKVNPEGSEPVIWDTFNFETDYDYSAAFPDTILRAGTYYIYMDDMPVAPEAVWNSGRVHVSFGGVDADFYSSPGSKKLGLSKPGKNTLTVSESGSIRIYWRRGAL